MAIPFDKWHGKAFRIATPPKVTDTKGNEIPVTPSTYSIITPENTDAWNSWPDASEENVSRAKLNWKQFNNSKTASYKKKQILRSIERLNGQRD